MQFIDYDPDFGWELIKQICEKHKIQISKKFYKKDRGTAWSDLRLIRIPKPTNVVRFAICIHEIKHVFDGHKGDTFLKELECEIYAINFLKDMGYAYWEYQKRACIYVLYHLVTKWNKKEFEIPVEVALFLPEINFEDWIGYKIYYCHDINEEYGYRIIKRLRK